jgi:hypothetical protein
MRKCKVEVTSRQVIENKLLIALNDESKVALVLSKQDIEDLIGGLSGLYLVGKGEERISVFLSDLIKLYKSAFQMEER